MINNAANTKPDLSNRKYTALSLLFVVGVSSVLIWLLQREGISTVLWLGAILGITVPLAFELAARLAKRDYERSLLLNGPSGSRVERYVAEKAKYKAQILRWYLPFACVAPVLAAAFAIKFSTYLIAGFLILSALSDGPAGKKATAATGYDPKKNN